jgi:creatinine amidohydrolase
MESGARIAYIPWTDVRPRLEGGAIAVLPVGAAAKEHGPHLPLATDWLTAEALGAALAEQHDVLVWPTLGYGYYPAFVDYPGSTSISEASFEGAVRDVVADLVRAGARAVLVVNTGISTIRPIELALAKRTNTIAVHVYRGGRYLERLEALKQQPRGGHADEAETSIMLHLHPELVDMDRAAAWTQPVEAGRYSPDDPESRSYSPLGIFGDATLATREKGEKLFGAMLEDLGAALVELRRAR